MKVHGAFKMQILLVDADPQLCATLVGAMEQVGYSVDCVQDGLLGLDRAETLRYDLILLDVLLPGLDGFSLCRRLRQLSTVPVIFVSARDDASDRIAGLTLGADDYVGKPFSLGELIARVEAVLRRHRLAPPGPLPEVLAAGDLRLDMGSHRVFRGNTEITLAPKDIEMLACLLRSDGQVLSRQTLQKVVWGDEVPVAARTVDVHIRWLRAKIEPDPARPRYIETVPGIGYRINKKPTDPRA